MRVEEAETDHSAMENLNRQSLLNSYVAARQRARRAMCVCESVDERDVRPRVADSSL